ncbi:chitin-binding domain protein cbd-1-like isoform X3 [Heptranchias perlo]|uniref:chitin-binding domain protein cbd-1-like isoform X3 n=1 Tax=Heptranchias perlo TaxID=212740 RepID=UPI00355A46B0
MGVLSSCSGSLVLMLLGQLGSCAPVVTFCNGKEVGIYADPKDVASFYQCLGNVTVYSTCQNNLIFDSGLAWCVSPPTALPPQSIAATPPAPAETLQAPAAASQAPAAATQAPAATTQAPAATTQAPAATTQAPAATTQAPAATTQAPAATTQAPAAASHTPVDLSGPSDVDPDFCLRKETGHFQDPLDRSGFYQCVFGQTFHLSCPDQLVFNPGAGMCDWPENVPIQGTFNSTFCKEKVDGNYANPINPSTFYQCSAGMAHHVACQTSLVYDEIANACVWPYSTPTTALPQITGTTNGSTTRKPNICCGKDDGLYPNPKDESSFLQCASEITFYMSCPTELVFNPLVNVCDRPTNDSK